MSEHKTPETPRLGAHMSIAGGIHQALLRGQRIGCDTIQIFTSSPNRWRSRGLSPKETQAFISLREETGIWPIVAHSSYLVNLASPDDELWKRSIDSIVEQLSRCFRLGISSYVLHPGAHKGTGEASGLQRIVKGLNAVLEATSSFGTHVLLETTAGSGSHLGYRFEQLAWLINNVCAPERVQVCVDTAHIFAAGYEFRTPETYDRMWEQFERIVGIERVRCIHLNDSLGDLGSRKDRHEHLGKGHIGLTAFRLLVSDERFRSVPMILETPKSPDLHEDVRNLEILRGFRQAISHSA